MIFVRGPYSTREFLKQCYYYLRSSIHDYMYMNQRRFTINVTEEEKELTYRVVMIENYKGRVAWKNGTGNYVSKGQNLCDVLTDDNQVHTILSPIAGMIANRFVDEGVYVRENSLICLMKVCDKPHSIIDREAYVYERKLYSRVSGELDTNELDITDLETIFGEQKRFRAKDFILPTGKEDDEENLDSIIVEERIESSRSSSRDIPADIMDKKRKDIFERYTPEDIKDEIRHLQIERDLSTLKQSDRTSNEFYKQLIDENFISNRQPLKIIYGSGKPIKFLQATIEIDLSSAFKFALNEGGRTNIKFELKYLILLGCLYAFKELPYLINSKDRSINITMGCIAGGKLIFPMIRNLEKIINLKDRLNVLQKNLIDGKDVEDYSEKRAEVESLAITNEWDYGNQAGPSCLYVSPHANLSLNAITIKPYILEDFKSHFLPIMSTTLMFNTTKIDGQDALLFLNKLKESVETVSHNTL